MDLTPRERFEAEVSPIYGSVYKYLRLHLPTDNDAQDVMQETLLGAWRGRESFDGANCSLKTWILAIARRKAADFYRAAYKMPEDAGADALELASSPDISAFCDTKVAVNAALAKLSPEKRELCYLIFTQRLTYKEAAQVMGVPEGTIKSRMSTIKAEMSKLLEVI